MTQHYYQWLPGTENEGQVVRLTNAYVEDGEIYYEFDNGDICCEEYIAPFTLDKNNLKGKMLVEIVNPNFKWKFEEIKSKTSAAFADIEHQGGGEFEVPCINDYIQSGENINSKVGTFNIIAPKTKIKSVEPVNYKDYMSRNDLCALGLIENEEIINTSSLNMNSSECTEMNSVIDHINLADEINNQDKLGITATFCKNTEEKTVINNTNNNDPIAILVNTSLKYPSSVSIDLDIDLPAVSLFKTVSENFENGSSKFIEHIIKHIDYSIITESLKEGLLNAYMQKISSNEN